MDFPEESNRNQEAASSGPTHFVYRTKQLNAQTICYNAFWGVYTFMCVQYLCVHVEDGRQPLLLPCFLRQDWTSLSRLGWLAGSPRYPPVLPSQC